MSKKTRKKNSKIIIPFLAISLLIFGGAAQSAKEESLPETSVSETTSTATDDFGTEKPDPVEETEEDTAEVQSATAEESEEIYTLDNIPEYSGASYVELGGSIPAFTEEDKLSTEPFEFYSELDELGRCGVAYANICQELMPTEERGSIGQIKPTGWHTVKYSDLIPDNYLYNRCHLIGYQLAGENANVQNLITGTRYLNIEGMLQFEDSVDAYVEETGNHVLYRVTPIFLGENLVASGVEMEGWSVEDAGEGICFHVYCYNVQPGVEIDYATGDSWVEEDAQTVTVAESTETEQEENQTTEDLSEVTTYESELSVSGENEVRDFILNTNTKRIHLPDCSSVDDMADKNKQDYNGTISELKDEGYIPCGRCLAEFRD